MRIYVFFSYIYIYIVFVYLYTPNIYEYCQHSIKNLVTYVNKYNYGLIVYDKIFDNNVYPCWNKIAAIIKNLSKYKYIVWFDADAIINNFDVKIESFINKYPNAHLLICNDINIKKECVNSGIMIIKNSQWSFNLFKKIWESGFAHEHNDQNVIFYEIVKEMFPNSNPSLKYSEFCFNNIHPNVVILSENDFNSNIQNCVLY